MNLKKTMLTLVLLVAAIAVGAGIWAQPRQEQPPPTPNDAKLIAVAIGGRVPNSNSLHDVRGNRRSLHSFKNTKAIVLAFLGTQCPVSNLYAPVLIELEKSFRGKQVQFLAIYANENEDLEQIAVHAGDRDFPFPVLKDSGQRLADLIGVSRVPTVAILDGDFQLRYRGRVSDQYGVASKRPKESRNDLAEALQEVLAGRKVTAAETETDGCLLDRARKQPTTTQVTYTKHVAPILQNRCQACHRPQLTAPFSLMTYADAVKHSAMIREVTAQRRMPPWHSDPRYGHFANERRLSSEEIETLSAWVDGGLVRGDDKDLPKPVAWAQGWLHGKPDVVFEMPEEFEVPATGVVPYKYWIVETNFKEEKWVRIAEGRPGTPGVVHHIVGYLLPEGQHGPVSRDGGMSALVAGIVGIPLVGWAPGDLGLVYPADTALRVPKGSALLFEMHYTPNGTKTKDRSAIGITFADKPPRYEVFSGGCVNVAIDVPPHDPHYKSEATFRLRADGRILALTPHMHWRGKDFRFDVIYPDGKQQTLLSVPRYDFNWQSIYRFKEPLKLPKGAKIHAVAHWDNSINNPLNPDPSKSVRFGLQSWEEMMVGGVDYVFERPEDAVANAKSQADKFFDIFDANSDDYLTPNELPPRYMRIFQAAGIKVYKISRSEFGKLFETLAPFIRPKGLKAPPGKKSSPLGFDQPQADAAKRRTTAPEYDDKGNLKLPRDFRTWVFVGSSIGLKYNLFPSPLGPFEQIRHEVAEGVQPVQKRKTGDFHNVYINPEAYQHYIKTGTFPDKTVLVMDVYKAMDKDPKNIVSGGLFSGAHRDIEVAVKNSNRPDKSRTDWAYYVFANPSKQDTAQAFPDIACYQCHRKHASDDNVWVQFYPVLRDRKAG